MLQRTDDKVSKIFKNLVDLPSLPAAVQKMVQLSEKDSSPREFAELIAADQGLTAKVLRLVNSAFYSLRSPISSLYHASTLLGTRTLKSMVLSVSVMNLFGHASNSVNPKLFWKHAVAVAVASQKLGRFLLPTLEEDLYVAGLLHDTGIALLAQHLPADYPLVLKIARMPGRNLVDVEEEVLGISHAELGCMLAVRWRLPQVVCDSIRHHERAMGLALPSGENVGPAVDLVRLADEWAIWCGLDFFEHGEESRVQPSLPAWVTVEISEIERVLGALKDDIENREEAFFAKKEKESSPV